MKEEFRPIVGYEGEYSISNFGRVWSHKRNMFRTLSKRGGERNQKYLRVNIKGKFYSVHRLVATAFIPNKSNKPTVNHIDGNPANNNVLNLEWNTYSENSKHASKTGLHPHMHQSKFTVDEMSEICEAHATGLFSFREIARECKASHTTIRYIVQGKTYNRRANKC